MQTGNERSRGKKVRESAETGAQPSTAPSAGSGTERKRLTLKFGG